MGHDRVCLADSPSLHGPSKCVSQLCSPTAIPWGSRRPCGLQRPYPYPALSLIKYSMCEAYAELTEGCWSKIWPHISPIFTSTQHLHIVSICNVYEAPCLCLHSAIYGAEERCGLCGVSKTNSRTRLSGERNSLLCLLEPSVFPAAGLLRPLSLLEEF
jgi:hypothetical protein